MEKHTIANMYTDDEFSRIVEQSSSLKEVIDRLGYSTHSGANNKTVKQRIDKLGLDTSHFFCAKRTRRTPENTFVVNSTASQHVLRKMYKNEAKVEYKCSICGQEPFWNGKSLTLILDHINGVNNDDRLENLRWVCPNCNQQLDTTGFHGQKNKKGERCTREEIVAQQRDMIDNYKIDDSQVCKKRQLKECVVCGNMTYNIRYCSVECERIDKSKNIPARDELKNLIREISFASIGKMYNVSDSRVHKWCKKYGLPHRASDIKNISDSEWNEI